MHLCDQTIRTDFKFLHPLMFVCFAYCPAIHGYDKPKAAKHTHQNMRSLQCFQF